MKAKEYYLELVGDRIETKISYLNRSALDGSVRLGALFYRDGTPFYRDGGFSLRADHDGLKDFDFSVRFSSGKVYRLEGVRVIDFGQCPIDPDNLPRGVSGKIPSMLSEYGHPLESRGDGVYTTRRRLGWKDFPPEAYPNVGRGLIEIDFDGPSVRVNIGKLNGSARGAIKEAGRIMSSLAEQYTGARSAVLTIKSGEATLEFNGGFEVKASKAERVIPDIALSVLELVLDSRPNRMRVSTGYEPNSDSGRYL